MGLRRRILLRLRPAVVLAVVVPPAVAVVTIAVLVTRVADALSVSVVLMAEPVAVVALVLSLLRLVPVTVAVAARLGLLADSGLRGRGDASAARPLGRCEAWRRRAGDGRRCGGPRWWARARARAHGCHPAGRLRGRSVQRWRDDGCDLARSGGWSRDGGVGAGRVEEVRRGEYEANRG